MAAPPDPARPLPPRPPKRDFPKHDFAAEEEAARRLTNAHIQFRRGLTADAEAAVQALLTERPQDAGAWELLGDIQSARSEWDSASASYQGALQSEPGRASAESKFAKLTLRRAETARQEKLGVAYAADDTAMVRREGGSRGAWPVILGAALCPGLGQVVQGQYVKGGLMIAVFVLGLGLLALLPHGASGRAFFGPAFWIISALLTGDWIYSVVDAVSFSARGER